MGILVTASGPDPGQTIDIPETGLLLGRAEDCSLVLDDMLSSSHHARVYRENRAWWVKDLQSSNGTLLNGRLIEEAALNEGDLLEIGESRFRFSLSDEVDTGRVSVPRAVAVDMSELEEPAPGVSVRKATVIGSSSDDEALIRAMPARFEAIRREAAYAALGRPDLLERLLVALLAGGHALVTARPGQGMTTLVSALAQVFGMRYLAFLCVEDLPADAVPSLTDAADRRTGPEADPPTIWMPEALEEASPGFQAALADALREPAHPSADAGLRWVVATCLPQTGEGEGPGVAEHLADRFLMHLPIPEPSSLEEEQILAASAVAPLAVPQKVVDIKPLLRLRDLVRRLPVSENVVRFAARTVRATRPGDPLAIDAVRKLVEAGAPPRGGTHLLLAAKARAVLHGRAQVAVEDVIDVAVPVLRHRIRLQPAARGAKRSSRGAILAKVVAAIPRRDGGA